MANISEVRLNVVRPNQPKRLRGWNQQVSGQDQGFPHFLAQMVDHRRTGTA
jgi:hypothetical protein